MIKKNTLAYYAKTRGAFSPVGPAHNFKNTKSKIAMLWGDEVYVESLSGAGSDRVARVSTKGAKLDILVDQLMEDPLLCWYQIDCGQGDAALVQLPDGRWIMIDAGPNRSQSNTDKIATDFLRWKMFVDQSWRREYPQQPRKFTIDALVVTHPDADHFGGFFDLLPLLDQRNGLRVDTVFHSGLGRFNGSRTRYDGSEGHSQLGTVAGGDLPDAVLPDLVDGFDTVRKYRKPTTGRPWVLNGEYGRLLAELEERSQSPASVKKMQRVDADMGYLPGYEPDGAAANVQILGPVVETLNGHSGLRYLDTAGVSSMKQPSLTRNGHSVVLRFDYGKVRLLLSGDLNYKSQTLLMTHHPATAFRSDVAKACHHGSEDISPTFMQAVEPMATIFSSGDNETHAHPRAKALAIAAVTGRRTSQGNTPAYLGFKEPRFEAPLIYSTELSRSVELLEISQVLNKDGARVHGASIETDPRSPNGEVISRPWDEWLLADRLVYGMIHVRTDGERVVIGALHEGKAAFQTEEFVID